MAHIIDCEVSVGMKTSKPCIHMNKLTEYDDATL